VVLATHSDQALALLADASDEERALLGSIRYQDNRAVLHTDRSVLPANPRAWAAWNHEHGGNGDARVCLHYLINRLQPLPWAQPVIVSLNPVREIARNRIMGEYDYAHPVFDTAAVQAQAALGSLQGRRRTWFAGAWTGYGFHEDGLSSGLVAARALLLQGEVERAQAETEAAA
jgi:predicted NAD/FAD-binding protein